MKFAFENLGFVKKGEIELGDLTIVCGKNNTGKTRIVHAIYGFMKEVKNIQVSRRTFFTEEQFSKLKSENRIQIDLKDYHNEIENSIQQFSIDYVKRLPHLFATSNVVFKNTQFEFTKYDWLEKKWEDSVRFITSIGSNVREEVDIFLIKEEDSPIVTIQTNGEFLHLKEERFSSFINQIIKGWILSNIPLPFIMTTERTGALLFHKVIIDAKLKTLGELQKLSYERGVSSEYVKEKLDEVLRYSQIVQDNLDTAFDTDKIFKQKSFISDTEELDAHQEILKLLDKILGGNFVLRDTILYYLPKGSDEFMPIQDTSSSVKSLFLLDVYIRYLANPYDILIIDEPELNLHPDKQILIARLIVQLVNVGVKVMLATHSDFLIREINNAIMLSKDFKGKKEFLKKNEYSELDILSPDKVKGYYFTSEATIHPLEMNKYGLRIKEIDDVINKANQRIDFLSDAMEEIND